MPEMGTERKFQPKPYIASLNYLYIYIQKEKYIIKYLLYIYLRTFVRSYERTNERLTNERTNNEGVLCM